MVPPPGRTGNSGLRLLRTGVVWAGRAGVGAGLLGRAGLEAITTGLIGAIEGLLAGPGGLVTRAGLLTRAGGLLAGAGLLTRAGLLAGAGGLLTRTGGLVTGGPTKGRAGGGRAGLAAMGAAPALSAFLTERIALGAAAAGAGAGFEGLPLLPVLIRERMREASSSLIELLWLLAATPSFSAASSTSLFSRPRSRESS